MQEDQFTAKLYIHNSTDGKKDRSVKCLLVICPNYEENKHHMQNQLAWEVH